MNTQEFRKFINEELDKVEAEHGVIPVVMWCHNQYVNKYLDEYIPQLLQVCQDDFKGLSDTYRTRSYGKVLILGE